jgi:hypothetical protein
MTAKTTLRLLVTVVLAGACIWYLEHGGDPLQRRRQRAARVVEMPGEAIDFLSVAWGDQHVDCVKDGSEWVIRWPMSAPAERGCVIKLVSELEDLVCEERISAAERRARDLSLEDYGLESPFSRLVVGSASGRETILVGTNAPLGDSVYVQAGDVDDVLAVNGRFLGAIPRSIDDLRDRTLLRGDPARVVRVEVEKAGLGFVQLARVGKEWRIVQPVGFRAATGWMAGLLEALFACRIDRFVWDPLSTPGDLRGDSGMGSRVEPYGLAEDECAARITVWMYGDQVGREITLGDTAGEGLVYARNNEYESVYAVPDGLLRVLSVSLNDLRAKTIATCLPQDVDQLWMRSGDARVALSWDARDGWLINDPVQWKADNRVVNELLAKLTALNIHTFVDPAPTNANAVGLDPASREIAWRMRFEKDGTGDGERAGVSAQHAPTGTIHRLLIGGGVPEGGAYFARLGAAPCVFTVRESDIAGWLDAGMTDPLRYRDRLVLSLPPERVRRIQIRRGDTEQRLVRSGADGWLPESMAGASTVRTNHVRDILFAVANLRSLRVDSHVPKSLVAYGLDQPMASLTFGLSGETGIQKTIHFGFRSKTDGLYAMVQGQDVVFVLETSLAELLTQDLLEDAIADD